MKNFVNDNNFDGYLKLMTLSTTYGDNITIQAMTENFNIQILVVSTLGSDGTRLIIFHAHILSKNTVILCR